MKFMKIFLILLFPICVMFCANPGKSDTPVDGSQNSGVTVQNNFTQNIFVEVWGGESLLYDTGTGTVSGTALNEVLAATEIAMTASLAIDLKSAKNIVIIAGFANNGLKEYLDHIITQGVTAGKTYQIDASGNLY